MSSGAAVDAVAGREIPGLLADGHSNTENVLVARRPRQANIKNRLEADAWALKKPPFRLMMAG